MKPECPPPCKSDGGGLNTGLRKAEGCEFGFTGNGNH